MVRKDEMTSEPATGLRNMIVIDASKIISSEYIYPHGLYKAAFAMPVLLLMADIQLNQAGKTFSKPVPGRG